MNEILHIKPWQLAESAVHSYDMALASIGYESRARYVSETVESSMNRRVALGFDRQKVCAYLANEAWFRRNAFEIQEVNDSDYCQVCAQVIESTDVARNGHLYGIIDISSMSRFRIASCLASLREQTRFARMTIDFVYAPAQYTRPKREMAQIESAGPVMAQFAGWSSEPERPVAAVFGLGYEYDRAVGVLEYLEPSDVWAFQVVSQDKRYDSEVERANRFLWQFIPLERRLVYQIECPLDCVLGLESLVFGLLRHSRPILVPFGPKVFALACFLVSFIHYPKIGVWRVSSGVNESPVDRRASGVVVGMRVEFTLAGQEGGKAGGITMLGS